MMVVGEHTQLSQRKKRAMARLILGFQGLLPPPEIHQFVKEYSPAGYILFRRNVEDLEQVWECNQILQRLSQRDMPPLLSVDQEGGRVRRIRNTNWPPMRYLGDMDHLPTTEKIIRGINQELLQLGFNANWAPCADVDSNPDNPVIGDRSFGREPALCARHVRKAIETMSAMKMIACAKHFPGHGDTNIDSHLDLPIVEKSEKEIEECELFPFREAINAGVEIMMTAHVVFPALDPDNPATMSKAILDGFLRKKYGYQNIIVSDDMEMKAVRGRYPLEQQLLLSTRAGVDLFLVCSEYELQQEAFEILVRMQEQSKEDERLAQDSFLRLQALQHRYLFPFDRKQPSTVPDFSIIGSEEYQALARFVQERGNRNA